jgi:hypothetical protein
MILSSPMSQSYRSCAVTESSMHDKAMSMLVIQAVEHAKTNKFNYKKIYVNFTVE